MDTDDMGFRKTNERRAFMNNGSTEFKFKIPQCNNIMLFLEYYFYVLNLLYLQYFNYNIIKENNKCEI